ncbi:sulfotransferase family protein [Mangrovimicrobium sediminis]|uniref:Sulfotransferase family protein n=1 Tax=Mangrovimicrobium sediminis TaxID=2562682 RepID=A0A4Z0LWJ2_9GAMM|nr:sulfotransferase [Haliea sp. SAOS-164]TGD71702.1 sulfotransferase family protein [Haliea sp. SAOS-164]
MVSAPTDTREPRALLVRGFRALSEGNLNEAATCCKIALGRDPKLAPAHLLVGLIGLESGDRRAALAAFSAVTRLQPQQAAAWAHLARLLAEGGQVNRADVALRNAMQRENNDIPDVLDVIGHALSLLGEYAEAESWFRRASQAQPDNPAYRVNLANNLIYLGKNDAAREELDAALRLGPGSAQAHWLLAGLERARDRSHIDEVRPLLERRPLPLRGQAFAWYAIGKELEDLEAWDEAFDAFTQGAKARRATLDYDEAQEAATFASLAEHYTAEWLSGCAPGLEDDSPVFIVGQPRSGTTLVERIVTAHSAVHSAGELQQFGNGVRRLTQYDGEARFSPQLFEGALALDPAALGRDYLQRTARLRGDLPRFVDKLPYNYLFLPHILAAFPRAKIIHLVRDPRDVCFSVFKQLFADAYPHSYDLGEMARHFVRYHQLMQTWRERFPGRFLDVHYEEVVADVDAGARCIIDYLELPWEDACRDFHLQSAAVSTASAVQVRQPAHTRSVARWRRYERQMAPAIDILDAAGVLPQD